MYIVHHLPGRPLTFDQTGSIQQSTLHWVFHPTMQCILLYLIFCNSLTLHQLQNIMHLLFHIRVITPNPNKFIFKSWAFNSDSLMFVILPWLFNHNLISYSGPFLATIVNVKRTQNSIWDITGYQKFVIKLSYFYWCRLIKSWNLFYIYSSIFSDLSFHFILQGCTLFFYETDGRSGIDHNSIHKHAVWVENSIVQAVPEHPKKDFVFCLSNALGDAFLFQVGQSESQKINIKVIPVTPMNFNSSGQHWKLLVMFLSIYLWQPKNSWYRNVPHQCSWSTVSFKTAEECFWISVCLSDILFCDSWQHRTYQVTFLKVNASGPRVKSTWLSFG